MNGKSYYKYCALILMILIYLKRDEKLLLYFSRRYLPEISEPSLKGLESLFAPDVKRESIFAGKKFVFLSSKQVRCIVYLLRELKEANLCCDG